MEHLNSAPVYFYLSPIGELFIIVDAKLIKIYINLDVLNIKNFTQTIRTKEPSIGEIYI